MVADHGLVSGQLNQIRAVIRQRAWKRQRAAGMTLPRRFLGEDAWARTSHDRLRGRRLHANPAGGVVHLPVRGQPRRGSPTTGPRNSSRPQRVQWRLLPEDVNLIGMRNFLLCTVGCGLAFCLTGSLAADDAVELAKPQPFLKQHCLACHGAEKQEAELRFDTLGEPTALGPKAATWSRIVQAIEAGEMPPEDRPRPSSAETQQFVRQINETIRHSAGDRAPALRRMNRREYENTMHDLLGIRAPLVDLLPEDGSVQGFDNVADGLSISSVLMEQYLEAANVALDDVVRRIKPLPAETRHLDLMENKENKDSVAKKKGGTITVDASLIKFSPGWPPARVDAVHPIEDGIYHCKLAVWPYHPGDRTLAVAIYVGTLFGPETREFIGIFDATGTADDPRVIEFTTHMREGHSIHIVPRIWPEHVTWRDKHEERPGVGIKWIETHGPLDQEFPSLAQQRLFGKSETIRLVEDQPIYMRNRRGVKLHIVESDQPRADAERIVREFIPRAFRRPVSDAEMAPFVKLTLNRLDAGRTFEQAVRAGLSAVLCSPQFLLLNRQPTVDDYTIASRLSYFLWSTMPDERLLQLAAAGKLSDPAARHAEMERMIADPRIERFVENFTGQWLDLRDIEATTPAAKLYPEFDPLLQEAMLGETRHFFRHILTADLSVANFIDSDFTFLNERIARHYGIEGVRGHEAFRKVDLPQESIRGGLLTQASLLKVTANGTTTSPVIRGVWVLDNLLGRPVPPPPPGVPAVEPDIRGATSIRDQLEKHRQIASCAVCHKRIDPPGFALEKFDAIGGEQQWYRSLGEGTKIRNTSYTRGQDVQLADMLPDGRKFEDFRQFRELLLDDSDQVAKAIATKLLVYGTGRPVTAADRLTVETIARAGESAPRGSQSPTAKPPGLKTMMHAVIDSELFLQP